MRLRANAARAGRAQHSRAALERSSHACAAHSLTPALPLPASPRRARPRPHRSFITDRLSVYIQSRSYRAPEVVLGLPYGPKIDIWSLGCIFCELLTGRVLFANDSVQTMLARIQSLLGAFPPHMLERGRDVHKYFRARRDGTLFERTDAAADEGGAGAGGEGAEAGAAGARVQVLSARRTNLRRQLRTEDEGFLGFVAALLAVDPAQRPSAQQALEHPWLRPSAALPLAPYTLPSAL